MDVWNLLIKKNLLLYLTILLAIVIPLLLVSQSTIVVFTVDRAIMSHDDAFRVTSELDKIQANPFVKALVLDIDSPGGTAEAIEEIYYRILSLREKMPVVASLNSIAASGAYYIASPSSYIFAKPSSEVGGIGVVASLPEEIERPDLIVSGPFKLRRTKESTIEAVELLKKDFIKVIQENRKERLKIDATELSSAELYIGIKAKEIGLVDELGSLDDAITKAARLANLVLYRTIQVKPLKSYIEISLLVEESELEANSTTIPKLFYVYINPSEEK